jgi:hypothetical protein
MREAAGSSSSGFRSLTAVYRLIVARLGSWRWSLARRRSTLALIAGAGSRLARYKRIKRPTSLIEMGIPAGDRRAVDVAPFSMPVMNGVSKSTTR